MAATFDPPDALPEAVARNSSVPGAVPMAEGPAERADPPRRPAGIKSPSVLSLQLSGWLLLTCMFLPLCRSCGGTVVHPVEGLSAAFVPPVHVNDVSGAVLLVSVYGYGVIAASLVTLSAWFCSPRLWWRSFAIEFALSVAMAALVACFVIAVATPKERLTNCLVIIPPLTAATTWVAAAIRRGARPLAWARLQHTWTMVAFVYLHLLCLFSSEPLFGYWLTLVGLLGMVIAVELARHRLEHDLWDATHPVQRPQFTLRNVFIWMTFVPLVVGYYQAIGPIVNWLFPDP